MPSISRMMIFIDGENFVIRYQDILKQGYVPRETVNYVSDTFVWERRVVDVAIGAEVFIDVTRVTYYTYAVGDEDYIFNLSNQIKGFSYQYALNRFGNRIGFVFPRIFKKSQRAAKRKGVDINITVDALTHTFRNSVDIVYLVTGDGDYLPLIEEIMRNGKKVYLSALSSGLNKILPQSVDKFFNLDDIFFNPK